MSYEYSIRSAILTTLLLFLSGSGLFGAEPDPCAEIEADAERLECYDAQAESDAAQANASFLERHWDLNDKGRRFQPWAHRPVYMLPVRWTGNTNEEPFEAVVANPDIQSVEAKFQISFKTKVFRDVFGGPGDLWFGYTQQSHFQVYNGSESRPFRETDFEPEAIWTFPVRRSWGGWNWRMVGVGVVHQSNGRSEPLSRSWNRIYAIAAAESGNFSVHVRPWVRFDSTDAEDDDNPDIEDFIGRFETVVQWKARRHVLAFRGRSSLKFDGHKGSIQADWFFPIRERVRGQLQVFSGYGESLIDFDHRHTAIGFGVLLFDPF